jgi:uncharacterized protein YndB with AHSA1/START domain
MIPYSSEVTIARPPGEVFPWLIEPAKQGQWSDVPMQPLTEGPLRQGSRMRLSLGRGPLHVSLDLEITSLEPDARLAFTTVSDGGIQWDGAYDLTPADGGGTRLAQQGTLRFRGLWRVLEPLIGAEIKRGEIAELERLKKIVEGPEASA